MHIAKGLLAGVALVALTSAAHATLDIAFTDGTNIFSCADGSLCDLAGPTSNLLTIGTDVGGFHVFGTLSISASGSLTMSNFGVLNLGSAEGTLTMIVGDTGFSAPVSSITESASLTFHNNVGAGLSSLKFWADSADTQPATSALVIPGVFQFGASGAAAQNVDSFSGSNLSSFLSLGAFSMTEVGSIDLLSGGSVTGFNMGMETAFSPVPELSTWAMFGLGLAGVAFVGSHRRRRDALAFPF